MMMSLTLMSPLEKMVDNEIKQFYKDTGPVTFTWEYLSPWAKYQWAKKFWKEQLDE